MTLAIDLRRCTFFGGSTASVADAVLQAAQDSCKNVVSGAVQRRYVLILT